jgi:hypothetical protein
MGECAKNHLEDRAFKENSKITFYEFTPLSYEDVSEKYIDTIRLSLTDDKWQSFIDELRANNEKMDKELKEMKIYLDLEWMDLYQMSKDNFKELILKKDILTDSINYYDKQDSIIRERISLETDKKIFYKLTLYIKATIKHNLSAESYNIMDTLTMVFDNNIIPYSIDGTYLIKN